jgi:predicted ATPase
MLLDRVSFQGFLSFGPATTLPLRPLNVLVGTNGSGKSNVVEALAVLRAVPSTALSAPVRRGGGVSEWLWQGDDGERAEVARLEFVFPAGEVNTKASVRYALSFESVAGHMIVQDERVENSALKPGTAAPFLFFGYERGTPRISARNKQRTLKVADIDRTQSILAQYREPDLYPELRRLAQRAEKIAIYRDWHFGPHAAVREPANIAEGTDRLDEHFRNLPQMIQNLQSNSKRGKRLNQYLADLSPSFDGAVVVSEGARLVLKLKEGDRAIRAERLSDGTLRFLCLLAILLQPETASLIVLEEPELGLHPDALLAIRDLLVEASATTQILLTTHSTVLLDAFTDYADSVVVVQKGEGGTVFRRLDQDWVDQQPERLGALWMSGAIGGVR